MRWLAGIRVLALAAAAAFPLAAQPSPWKAAMEAGKTAYEQGRYAEAEKNLKAALLEAESFGAQDPRLAETLDQLIERLGQARVLGAEAFRFEQGRFVVFFGLGIPPLLVGGLAGLHGGLPGAGLRRQRESRGGRQRQKTNSRQPPHQFASIYPP